MALVPASASASRMPTFSLVEFRDLLSSALDSPEPCLSFTAFSLFTPSLERKKSSSNLRAHAQQQQHSTASVRVRHMLAKMKKRAASLVVKRPRIMRPRHKAASSSLGNTTTPRTPPPTFSPASSVITGNDDDDDIVFAPYLPLALQFERRRLLSLGFSSQYLQHTGSTTSSLSSTSLHSHALPPPPSPAPTVSTFDASECSTSSVRRPWSVLSVDVDMSFSSDDNIHHLGAGVQDPFAKDEVCVVHRSCDALPLPMGLASLKTPPRRRHYRGVRRLGEGRRGGGGLAPVRAAAAEEEDVDGEWTPVIDSHTPTPTPTSTPTRTPSTQPRIGRSRSLAYTRTPSSGTPRRRPSSPFPLRTEDSAYFSVCSGGGDDSSVAHSPLLC